MSVVVYALMWVAFNVLGRLFFRYRTDGTKHIPRQGGVLFAANHASYLDIPLLGCGIPRRVALLGRATLFPHPLIHWMMRSIAWIPLKTGRLDRKALGDVVSRLKAGKAVVIFPEGTRTQDGQLQNGKPGIGVILKEIQVPVVPAYIEGTYEALPIGASMPRFSRVTVRFGEPMQFSRFEEGEAKVYYHHVSNTVMGRIAELGRVPAPTDSQVEQ